MNSAPRMPGRHLQDLLEREVPLARAMGVTIKHYGSKGLVLSAPLAQNRNYKGTAFAGSLATAATLSGWALTMLLVENMAMCPEVVVSRSVIEYLRPVREDIEVLCPMPDEASIEKLQRVLTHKRIGRWELRARITAQHVLAVDYTGTYVVTVEHP